MVIVSAFTGCGKGGDAAVQSPSAIEDNTENQKESENYSSDEVGDSGSEVTTPSTTTPEGASSEAEETEKQQEDIVYGEDVLGSYNGIPLTCNGDSWSNIFEADDWYFVEDEEFVDNRYVLAQNYLKYDNVSLYLYNKGESETSIEEVTENGSYGYSISTWADAITPNMTWNGVTWGASFEDIKVAYGEPSAIDEGASYIEYDYDISENITIEFWVRRENGLQSVTVHVY